MAYHHEGACGRAAGAQHVRRRITKAHRAFVGGQPSGGLYYPQPHVQIPVAHGRAALVADVKDVY